MHRIREGTARDLGDVLALNQAEAKWTSDLDQAALERLINYRVTCDVLTESDHVVGFILVMCSTSAYPNANLDWFNSRLSDFWYIDRIVVDSGFSGKGYGRLLYEHTFSRARERRQSSITCEYSTQPMNAGSAAFHARMGFREIGHRVDDTSGKHLSMQVYDL
jgi:predicted GNAT superfamily acetyltransferase